MSDNWKEETRSAYLYRVLAKKEKNTPQGRLFEQLALEAEKQAKIWDTKKKDFTPDWKTRLISLLIRRLGVRSILPVLAATKIRGLSIYSNPLSVHFTPRARSEVGGRHRSAQSGGSLRAAIFGMNDGLVSNTSLILGVAGAAYDPQNLILAGSAGLMAGALSMAAGEYISVRSQRELYEYQIGLEREELEKYPEEEAAELALIYEAKGMNKAEANLLAKKIIQNPEVALDTLAREELGLNPEDLGSPWKAGMFSLISFSIGAAVPLLPLLFGGRSYLLWTSFGASLAALFVTGAISSLFTGRSSLYGGFRMLLIGCVAGGFTYFIGNFVGHNLIN